MKIHFACPSCNKSHSVNESLAGRRGRCKDCGAVMLVPGSPAGATAMPAPSRTAAPSGAAPVRTPKPAARPKPAPTLPPPPDDDVNDPYGLADEPAPMPIRSDMLADAEDSGGAAPLPRGGMSRPDDGPKKKKKKKKRRGTDEGPWGMGFRQGAIGLMVLVLFLGRAMKYVRRAHQEGEVGPYLFGGMLILCLLAAAFSVISVVGAIISFSRGNRSAFQGESAGGQAAWGLSVLASVVVAYLYLAGALGFSGPRGSLTSLDASLSATERAPLMVYEDLVESVIRYHNQLADALDKLGDPGAGMGLDAAMDLNIAEGDAQMVLARSRATPTPTRDQTRQLFDKYASRYREGVTRAAASARAAQGRVNAAPGSPAAEAMQEIVDNTTKYAGEYAAVYPEGSTDATGWYFVIFSRDAGTGAGAPPAG